MLDLMVYLWILSSRNTSGMTVASRITKLLLMAHSS